MSSPELAQSPRSPGRGALVIIGGNEEKKGEQEILREVVRLCDGRPMIIATSASDVAAELWTDYERIFRALGIRDIRHLDIEHRDQAADPANVAACTRAGCVFMTGGDQLRLTSRLGGSPTAIAIREAHAKGCVLAGTSAGASAMSETMLISGPGDETAHVRDALHMAPGMGFLSNVVVDQHFSQRGRFGRLAAAVAQNPRMLGLGVDENTAVVVEGDRFRVIGRGTVHVLDGHDVTRTNLDTHDGDHALSVFHLRVHLLSRGDSFDLAARSPRGPDHGAS